MKLHVGMDIWMDVCMHIRPRRILNERRLCFEVKVAPPIIIKLMLLENLMIFITLLGQIAHYILSQLN